MTDSARDRVERERAEQALRESEERFRIIADTVPLMIWMSGPDKRCAYFNKSWLDFTGHTLEQELGNGWIEDIHPDDYERCFHAYITAFDARQPFTTEYRLRRFDGEYRWILDCGGPRWTPEGGFAGYIDSCVDITERYHAADMQRFMAEASTLLATSLDYETRLQNVAQLAVPRIADWCAIDILGDDGSIRRLAVVHVDPAKVAWAYEMQREYPTDLNASAGLGYVIRTGQSEFHSQITDAMLMAAARDPRHLEIMRQIGFTSIMIVPLVARRRTFGAIIFVSAESGRHYTTDNLAIAEELARRAALAIDNARLYQEARQQREWLRGTLSSIGDAVIATDMKGAITFMNAVAESLTGWPQAEVVGRPLDEVFRIINEATRAPVENPVVQVLREGTVIGLANHTVLLARDGAEIPIDDSGAPIRDDDGHIIGVVLVFRDISERKRAELAQVRLAAIVESSDDAIISKTLDGMILNWNAGAEQIYGYTAEEMLGRPIARIFPADRLDELTRILEQLKRGDHIDHYETERVRKDGARIHISLTVSPIKDTAGKVVAASTIARDITERKRAEEELRKSRDQLDIILRGVGDGITVLDPSGELIYANDAAARLSGYSSAQAMLEEPVRDVMAKFELLDEAGRLFPLSQLPGRLALQGIQSQSATLRFRVLATGEERWSVISSTPVLGEDGQVQFAVNIFHDVTERKRAEQEQARLTAEIKSQRQRLRTLIASVPGVVWEAWGTPDAATQRIDFVSDYVETMLGYSVEQWLATPNFWLTIVHPDDKERAAREAVAIFASGQAGTSEFRWIARDGHVLWVESQSIVICDEAGQPIGMRGVTIDISGRKRIEDAQRFLAEASNVLAASLDYETTLERVAGLAVPDLADWCAVHILEEDGAIRRLAVAHVDPAKAARALERPARYPIDPNAQYIVPKVLRTGRSEMYSEVPDALLVEAARDAEHLNTLRLLGFKSYICVPLLAHGRTLGAITLVMAESGRRYDADDLALAEELARRVAVAIENARLYREAQDAVRVREVFLSVASHELKTPLTTLLGNAQLFQRRASREQSLNERDSRSLSLIVEQASRLNRMIEALLDLSRIETGQLSIERAPVDLGALARRMLDEAQPALDEHTITYHPPGEPLIIVGDELRLEQVIQNLIQNAIKYSPSGGRIDVEVARRGDRACVAVTDQGIGIPPAALPRLFSRFYRASNVNPQQFTGMGVGLYVVKEIVNLHGGEVEVTSQEGEGSTFTICLPLKRTNNNAISTALPGI